MGLVQRPSLEYRSKMAALEGALGRYELNRLALKLLAALSWFVWFSIFSVEFVNRSQVLTILADLMKHCFRFATWVPAGCCRKGTMGLNPMLLSLLLSAKDDTTSRDFTGLLPKSSMLLLGMFV
ncbi:hypothetical protein DM02DRAFT_1698 [Periconia macrospinosa]|uniref:Uncharacterized protein n=1 Tax=Periconia macrospinosa TaxID=97972 RepID=A0A2V1ECU6_9PLEO|nr:hypothetical protein DM02DRAFT_1698 [Periconia macrospinosa]